uniref:Prefoldin subunit 5 n=4 Tax=Salmoninae TaxID=504568 RepID=A0A8C7QDG8_ONCMY
MLVNKIKYLPNNPCALVLKGIACMLQLSRGQYVTSSPLQWKGRFLNLEILALEGSFLTFSNMAVNLTELSLPQLEGLKTQLEQETEFLTSSIGQLKVVQTKYVEAKDSLSVLNKNNAGKELLVPLTSSMYVPGTLNDVEHVLVDVGTGYYVEKNVNDTKEFFKRKIDFLTKQIEKIQPALQEKYGMKQAVIEVMNIKIQQLQSQQASQSGTTKA